MIQLGAKQVELKIDSTPFPIGKMAEMYLRFENTYDVPPIIHAFVACNDSSIPHSDYPYFTYDNLTSEGVRIRHTAIDLEKFDLIIRVFGYSPECVENYTNFELTGLLGYCPRGF